MNKLNQFPQLLEQAQQQWHQQRPDLPVDDASLLGLLIGVAANTDELGLAALKAFGLGQSEHDVLACLRRQGAPFQATPSLLLQQVRLTSGALTACLKRLQQRQWITREESPTDQRVRPIRLTESGKQLIDEVTKRRFHMSEKILEPLSTEDKQQLKRALLLVQKGLGTAN